MNLIFSLWIELNFNQKTFDLDDDLSQDVGHSLSKANTDAFLVSLITLIIVFHLCLLAAITVLLLLCCHQFNPVSTTWSFVKCPGLIIHFI